MVAASATYGCSLCYLWLQVAEAAASGGVVTLKLKQSWFLADGSAAAAGEEKVWTVPVSATLPKTQTQTPFLP